MILAAVAGLHLAEALQDRAGAEGAVIIAACAVALVAGWAFIPGGPRVRAFTVTAMGFGLLLTLFPAMVRSRVTIPGQPSPLWVPGERYTTAPILLIYAVAVVAADASLRRAAARPRPARPLPARPRPARPRMARPRMARPRMARPRMARPRPAQLAVWVLLLALGAVWASDIRYVDSRSSYPSWPPALSSARSRCLGRPWRTSWCRRSGPSCRARQWTPAAAVPPGGRSRSRWARSPVPARR